MIWDAASDSTSQQHRYQLLRIEPNVPIKQHHKLLIFGAFEKQLKKTSSRGCTIKQHGFQPTQHSTYGSGHHYVQFAH